MAFEDFMAQVNAETNSQESVPSTDATVGQNPEERSATFRTATNESTVDSSSKTDTQVSTPSDTSPKNRTEIETPPTELGEDTPQSIRDYLAQHPEERAMYDRVNAEINRGWQPKLQEAAEYRKAFEGIAPQDLQIVQQVYQAMQTNPAQAAEWFAQQAELIRQSVPEPEPDPLESYIPQTDAEAIFMQQLAAQRAEVQQMKAWQAQQIQYQQNAILQSKATQVHSEFDKLEEQTKIKLPIEERAKLWEIADKAGLTPTQAFYALKHGEVLGQAVQKATNDASSHVQNKLVQSAGNPGNSVNRTEETPETPKSFEDWYRLEMAGS